MDLVIALDVSGSMGGLIDSARQRLWDIVNDLGRAQPQPTLRVGVISFGNPGYGAESGYVRIDQPLTGDLDAVNQTLFAFQVDGGDEYVARAIHTAASKIRWSEAPDALKIVFVAGNEGATQDPQITVEAATSLALDQGIVVNTLYCGGPNDSDATGWAHVAGLSQGLFASIDQSAAAVAAVATPMDDRLLELNQQLNSTYIAYGKKGREAAANQVAQDKNAQSMSAQAAASRAVSKASKMYNASHWDLVDAVKSGVALDEVEAEALPEPMRAMAPEERAEYVAEKDSKRQQLREEIAELDRERRAYIASAQAERQDGDESGLDQAIREAVRKAAQEKGFSFDKS